MHQPVQSQGEDQLLDGRDDEVLITAPTKEARRWRGSVPGTPRGQVCVPAICYPLQRIQQPSGALPTASDGTLLRPTHQPVAVVDVDNGINDYVIISGHAPTGAPVRFLRGNANPALYLDSFVEVQRPPTLPPTDPPVRPPTYQVILPQTHQPAQPPASPPSHSHTRPPTYSSTRPPASPDALSHPHTNPTYTPTNNKCRSTPPTTHLTSHP